MVNIPTSNFRIYKDFFFGMFIGSLITSFIYDVMLRDFHDLQAHHKLDEEITMKQIISDGKPVIYTFYEDINSKNDARLLESWKISWQGHGWEPRVLTMKEAMSHPDFSRLRSLVESQKLSNYENICFYRWAAMAHAVPELGGWMSDMDTFPLHIKPEEGLRMPNGGRFTCHDAHVPALMSGSKSEWNRMLKLLIDSWRSHKGTFSDMFLLETVLKIYGEEAAHIIHGNKHLANGFEGVSGGIVDCSKYNADVKAVHFSHSVDWRAFLGGWLEEEMRKEHGRDKLKFETKEGAVIRLNKKSGSYENIDPKAAKFVKVFRNGNSMGEIRHAYPRYRGNAGIHFIKEVINQCK